MRYFVAFKEGKVSTSWQREEGNIDEIPIGVKKEDVLEVSKNQYDNRFFLLLEGNEVVYDRSRYDEYLESLEERRARVDDIAIIKKAIKTVESWNSMQDINIQFLKKFFIRLIKELKD